MIAIIASNDSDYSCAARGRWVKDASDGDHLWVARYCSSISQHSSARCASTGGRWAKGFSDKC